MAYSKFIKSAPTITVATAAYTDLDVVGGLITFELTGLTQNGGILNSVLLTDAANQSEPFRLYLFDSLPSTIADADAFAPTIADFEKAVCCCRNWRHQIMSLPNRLGLCA